MSARAKTRRVRNERGLIQEIRSGEIIDRFRVGELLHEGGMARLYRATHPDHGFPLIMKVPKLGPGAPLSACIAFENELRILQRVKGTHVPRLVAAGDLTRSPYLVMEYIEGDALAEAAAAAPLDVTEVCAQGIRLCKAVHELHRQNVIHLDINPRNVCNRPNGDAVLVDYGLAHHAALPDMMDAAFGEEEGTTPYIAPEQVRHVRTESRADIFAIGAILYLLATGVYPFGRPNLLSLKKRLFQSPPPPRAHDRKLPAWLQEIILRCLEIHPVDRYRTAKQVAYYLAHPDSVRVTRRGKRTRNAGWLTRTRLWVKSLYTAFDDLETVRPYERMASAPHVLVALDLGHASESLKEVLRHTVRKFARNEPHSYFTCLTVIPTAESYMSGETEGTGTPPSLNVAAVRMAEIRNWAQPLQLPPERIFFQVIPGDPGSAIVDYAHHHVTDYIIVGARGSSTLRRYLGSVSSKVVAEAPCTVTVVRSRRDPA